MHDVVREGRVAGPRVGGFRVTDVIATTVLTALAVLLGVMPLVSDDPTMAPYSHSVLIGPVAVLAALPVLWWRRSPLAVVGVCIAVFVVHDLMFGPITRCGFGLPLSFTLAFLTGLGAASSSGGVRATRWGHSVAAVALTAVLAGAVLVWDTAAGPEILPVVVVILAVLHGIGLVTGHRSALGAQLRRRNAELAELREQRAALEVADDRLEVSRRLETVIDARLTGLEAAADAGRASDDPARTREALVALEEGGRRTLEDMREVVGTLRGGGASVSTAPTPSIAQLEELLDRRGDGVLVVHGDPRVLPAGLELTAYRIVETLVEVMEGRPQVALRFGPDDLGVDVAGPVARGADVRGALARVRERVRVHAGTVDAGVGRVRGERTDGGPLRRAHVEALLPVAAV